MPKRYKVGDILLTKDNCVCIVLSVEDNNYIAYNLNEYLFECRETEPEKIKNLDSSSIETRIAHSYDFNNLLSSLPKKIRVTAKIKNIALPF